MKHPDFRMGLTVPRHRATYHKYGTRINLEAVAGPLMGRAAIWSVRNAFPELRSCSGGLYEISYIYDGILDMELDDGTRLRAHGGDICILQPDTFHRCAFDVVMPCSNLLMCVFPKPPWPCPPFKSGAEMTACLRVLKKAGNRVARARPESHAAFLALQNEARRYAEKPGSTADIMLIRFLLFEAFAHILRSLSGSAQTPDHQAVQRAMRFIAGHLTERMPRNGLVRAAGLSTVRLYQLFRTQTGTTPADYRMRLRLEKAMEKLRLSSTPVTEIATELAFSSSQHFAQCFKKHFAITPSEYRRHTLRIPPRASSR